MKANLALKNNDKDEPQKRRYKLAKIQTQGVGLGLKQSFEALKSGGANKVFENECFVSEDKDGFWLLSKDFKNKIFASKERVLCVEILVGNLAGLYRYEPLEKAV